ncbi:MAG: hypothetical protein PHW96_02610 [Candidatus Nanoarchaeia archaeon]|nr:hypothetical protein [Candidatus Nanoarchaeia archaeon]
MKTSRKIIISIFIVAVLWLFSFLVKPVLMTYVFAFFGSALVGWILINPYMKLMRWMGITGRDVHKKDDKEIPEMGGIVVIASFIFGLLIYTSLMTFVIKNINYHTEIFAVALSILSVALVGLFDDMIRKMGAKKGLKQWQKPLMSLVAAIPLVAISAGQSIMAVPIFGVINFGILFPLVIIPLIVIFVSNAINLLAGFNGLEAGMTLVACISMGIYGFVYNVPVVVAIMASICGAIIIFLLYNKYPAKIFPGDSFTYGVGATIAATMIVGNMERFGMIILIPWVIEFFLKLSSKFKSECYGKLNEDGTLSCSEKRVGSLTHVVMKIGRFKEWQVSLILVLFEIVICLFAFMVSL